MTDKDVPELVRYSIVTNIHGWDHEECKYGEYVRYDQAAAIIAAKDALLETANALITCCCGSDINGHGIGDGHSPVSQYHYALYNLENRAEAAESKLAEWQKADRLVSAALWEKKVEALKAKLAQIEKQEPVSKFMLVDGMYFDEEEIGDIPLYASPVASDADLRTENERLREALEACDRMFRLDIRKLWDAEADNFSQAVFDVRMKVRAALTPPEPRT